MVTITGAAEAAEDNSRIWDEIYYYQGKIDEYTEKICSYGTKIIELENLEHELARMKGDFEERQQQRKAAVFDIQGRKGNIRMITQYARDMEMLLNGEEYRIICSDMTEAQNRVNEKINYYNEEMQFFKSAISSCEETISYWYGRLK